MSDPRMARGPQEATYWIEVKAVRNISVKEYESSDRGNSGRDGKLILSGALHIKPKGAAWDVEFPFNYKCSMSEEPRSGTLVFQPDSREPLARLVMMATMDYEVENTITKMLGRVEFVPFDDRSLRSAAIDLAASLPSGSAERRRLIFALRVEKQAVQGGGAWAAGQIDKVLGILKDVVDDLEARPSGESLADVYSEANKVVAYIRQISGPLARGAKGLHRLR